MQYEIAFLPFVYEDIKESYDFYNSRLKGLGKEFVKKCKIRVQDNLKKTFAL